MSLPPPLVFQHSVHIVTSNDMGCVFNPCSWPQTLYISLMTLSIYALFLFTFIHTRLVAGASDHLGNNHRRCRMSFSGWVMGITVASRVRTDRACRHHDTGRKCFSCAGPAIPSHITALHDNCAMTPSMLDNLRCSCISSPVLVYSTCATRSSHSPRPLYHHGCAETSR